MPGRARMTLVVHLGSASCAGQAVMYETKNAFGTRTSAPAAPLPCTHHGAPPHPPPGPAPPPPRRGASRAVRGRALHPPLPRQLRPRARHARARRIHRASRRRRLRPRRRARVGRVRRIQHGPFRRGRHQRPQRVGEAGGAPSPPSRHGGDVGAHPEPHGRQQPAGGPCGRQYRGMQRGGGGGRAAW